MHGWKLVVNDTEKNKMKMHVCERMSCHETWVLLPRWKLGRFLRWTGGLNFWQAGWHTFRCPSASGTLPRSLR